MAHKEYDILGLLDILCVVHEASFFLYFELFTLRRLLNISEAVKQLGHPGRVGEFRIRNYYVAYYKK